MKQCSKKFDKVFYTSGNHEYYHKNKSIEEIDEIITKICSQYDNVHYLQNNYYDFEDLRIVGSTLWSDVKDTDMLINDYSNVHKADKQLITISDTLQMYNTNKKYIESSQKPVLIMTHHLPSYEMILPMYEASPCKSHFASNLNYLFKKLLLHGYVVIVMGLIRK
jgi:predicted phosphohydrolase